MTSSAEHPVIPEGEIHCVWMDAGLVDYKLCDRESRCDACPFDEMIRLRAVPQTAPPLRYEGRPDVPETGGKVPDDGIEFILEKTIGPVNRQGLPGDRLYHLNHMWVYNDRVESVTVGVDHIAAHLMKPIVGVVLPQTPTHVEQDAPCIWIVMRDGTITLRSPVAGTVVRVNKKLRGTPSLVNTDPYTDGWFLHIAPSDIASSLDQLRSPSKIASQYSGDIEKMTATIRDHLRKYFADIGPTLADGGSHVSDIQDILGPKKYSEIIRAMIFGKR